MGLSVSIEPGVYRLGLRHMRRNFENADLVFTDVLSTINTSSNQNSSQNGYANFGSREIIMYFCYQNGSYCFFT